MVLNSTLDYTGVNAFGCATLTASTSLATPSITTNSIQFSAGTKLVQDVSTMDFNASSLLYKTIMRKATVGAGIELYDTQFCSTTHAMLSFICGNATSNYTGLKFYQPYNVADTAGTAFGQSFQMGQRSGWTFIWRGINYLHNCYCKLF